MKSEIKAILIDLAVKTLNYKAMGSDHFDACMLVASNYTDRDYEAVVKFASLLTKREIDLADSEVLTSGTHSLTQIVRQFIYRNLSRMLLKSEAQKEDQSEIVDMLITEMFHVQNANPEYSWSACATLVTINHLADPANVAELLACMTYGEIIAIRVGVMDLIPADDDQIVCWYLQNILRG